MVKLKIFEKKSALYDEVAREICCLIQAKPRLSLGLATGNTQVPLYQSLIRIAQAKNIDFSQVSTFNLDEYVGIPESSVSSFRYYMKKHLFNTLPVGNSYFPYADDHRSITDNISQFEQAIVQHGGIDFQLLGIGRNGHIGFNEPPSQRDSQTREVMLAPETLEDNKKDLIPSCMPTSAVTMGINTIYQAKKIALIAVGENKAMAIRHMLEYDISPDCPASYLQDHPNLTVYADPDAVSLLNKRHQ